MTNSLYQESLFLTHDQIENTASSFIDISETIASEASKRIPSIIGVFQNGTSNKNLQGKTSRILEKSPKKFCATIVIKIFYRGPGRP